MTADPAAPGVPAGHHAGLPVAGYQLQSTANVGVVNYHKEIEERLLRRIDVMMSDGCYDKRWLAIARTEIEKGFMALNRAVFQPSRVALPEDS